MCFLRSFKNLKIKQAEKEGGIDTQTNRQKKRSSICWFNPQITTTGSTELNLSQNPSTQSSFP